MEANDKIDNPVERNRKVMKFWMRHWAQNSVVNHSSLQGEQNAHSLYEIKDIGKMRPAIVVGGGASLDDLLDNEEVCDRLREVVNSEMAMLICPNSVTRPVLARGLKPWAFVSMHPTSDIVEGFRLGPEEWMDFDGKKLITATSTSPSVINRWLGYDDYGQKSAKPGEVYLSIHNHSDPMKVVVGLDEKNSEATVVDMLSSDSPSDWYGSIQPILWNTPSELWPPFPWQERGLNLPYIPNMGFVANYGVLVAALLGCSPVITIGMDYSFVPSEEGHPRWRCDDWMKLDGEWKRIHRFPEDDLDKISKLSIKEAIGLHGNLITCHDPMVSYRDSIHTIYKSMVDLDGNKMDIVNCSTDGIVTDLPRGNILDVLDKIEKGEWCHRNQS